MLKLCEMQNFGYYLYFSKNKNRVENSRIAPFAALFSLVFCTLILYTVVYSVGQNLFFNQY